MARKPIPVIASLTMAQRMAATRADRKARELCWNCGEPVAFKVILDGTSGKEVFRKKLARCSTCLLVDSNRES